jgi:beta-lactamase superfamily II metal-dependent hydrolase
VWDQILEEWGTEVLEDVHVLKAAHHGRKDGFHREAVEAMDPAYVIVSVGKKDDQDAYDNYRSACSDDTEILSTRQYGRIKAICTRPNSIIVDKAEPDGIFDLPDA